MTLTISTNEADSEAAEAIVEHHAQMAGAVATLCEAVIAAAAAGAVEALRDARDQLADWCRTELLPHAFVEEEVLYAAARGQVEGRLLIDAMVVEHASLDMLTTQLESDNPTRIASAAHALHILLSLHIDKENNYVVPLLAATPGLSLADLLDKMHLQLGATANDASSEEDNTAACGCHEEADPSYPVLDARAVPHAIRHATVFGALEAIRAGRGLILVAPHDPLPLLAQLERRSPGAFSVSYLERGPEAWRLSVVRN